MSRERTRYKRRIRASGILFSINVAGLIACASLGGYVLRIGGGMWFIGGAFLCFTAGLIVPALKEMLGFADEFSGVEEAFYRDHVDKDVPREDQEVFSSEGENVWKRWGSIPVTAGLGYTVVGVILIGVAAYRTFL